MSVTRRIEAEEFEEIFGEPLNERFRKRCANEPFEYRPITPEERDDYLLDVVRTLMKSDLAAAGEHRFDQWEAGWRENLRLLSEEGVEDALVPKYYGKHPLSRWRQQIIRPVSSAFDYAVLAFLVDWAIHEYARDAKALFEFGCGPACHLLRLRKVDARPKLVGLDWTRASQRIISQLAASGAVANMEGRRFDFFQPDSTLEIPPGSCVYTVAALEQLGSRFEPFLQFLMEKKPGICIHFEPIGELLDERVLIDALSLYYFRKRTYLDGFLTRLRQLQAQGNAAILRQQRTYSGSYFIEGHSLIVWRPL